MRWLAGWLMVCLASFAGLSQAQQAPLGYP